MTVITIEADDLLTAWSLASDEIAKKSVDYIMVVTFGTAWNDTANSRTAVDQQADAVGAERPSSVASMLLPRGVRLSGAALQTAIDDGQRLLGRARRAGLRFSTWRHTYFERITGAWYNRSGNREVIKPNRLFEVVDKINRWGVDAKAALYIHTDLSSDTFRTRGNPCLQYLQFRLMSGNRLSLVALYRSHDYFNKALGNYIGLNDVASFVCRHTGRTLHTISVISLNPFCESVPALNAYRTSIGAHI